MGYSSASGLGSPTETDRLLAPGILPVIEAIRAANRSAVDPATLPLAEARAPILVEARPNAR